MVELRYCHACKKLMGKGTRCSFCQGKVDLVDETFFLNKQLGKHRLESIIGIGGMGIVFKGRHLSLNSPVAIKLLLPEIAQEAFIKRFQREARFLAELRHPHIVEIFDLDISPWGPPYYVMEYLEGDSLRQWMDKHPQGIPLPLFQPLFLQMLSALEYAHQKQVIHRDLKPENIFIVEIAGKAHAKILDFGIAKILGERQASTRLTATGMVMGTPAYMAPEQVMGENIGPYTDQYALGLIAVEMLTGKSPRHGKSLGEIIAKDLQKPIEVATVFSETVPQTLKEALAQATAPKPEDRFPSLSAFREAIEAIDASSKDLATSPTLQIKKTTPIRSSVPLKSPKKKIPYKIILLVVFALFVLVMMLLLIHPKAFPPKKTRVLDIQEVTSLPIDATHLLGSAENYCFLKGSQNIYVLDPSLKTPPTVLPLEPKSQVLRRLEDGGVAVMKGQHLFRRTFLYGETVKFKDELLYKAIPPYDRLWISQDAQYIALLKNSHLVVLNAKGNKLFSIILKESKGIFLDMTNKYLTYLQGDYLHVYALPSGKKLWKKPFPDAGKRIFAFQVDSHHEALAMGGWFDRVYYYPLKHPEKPMFLDLPGITLSIAFLPDSSLAIGKTDKFILWNPKTSRSHVWIKEGVNFSSILLGSEGIWLVDSKTHKLFQATYRGFPIKERVAMAKREIWALAINPKQGRFLVGGSDGVLYEYDPEKRKITPHNLHTQGITSMVVEGNYLATASDDATIAIWNLDKMNIAWRSELHDFLINYLFFHKPSQSLWSSSSDGTVKQWFFPKLKKGEVIHVPEASCHAFFLSPDQQTLLVGTWNYRLWVYQKKEGQWKGEKSYDMPCQSLYTCTYLPAYQLVFFVGVYPTHFYVYHLPTDTLFEVDHLGLSASWCTTLPDQKVLVSADNGLMTYTFKETKGKLAYQPQVALRTDLHKPLAGTLTKHNQLVLGNGRGELLVIPLKDVPFIPLRKKNAKIIGIRQ